MTRIGSDAAMHGAARAVLAGMWHCALGSLAAGLAASAVLGLIVLLFGA